MRYLDTCDGNMQEGSLRADVNVSVRKEGDKKFGTRCEIKNVNSIKFMQMAIEYEASRQVELIENGKKVDQETRLFDTKKNETRSMRSKEDAHDYRYFPDPDLLPLKLEQKLIDDLKKSLPELPDKKKERFIKEYGLNTYEANVLVSEKEISEYYEEVAKLSDKKLAATWMMGDLFAMLNDKGLDISKSPISAKYFAELVQSIKSGEISGRIAKEVFEIMLETGDNPKKIIESKGLKQQSDPKELEKMINEILVKNKDKVDQYKSGKDKLFGFFVGQVMKSSGGKANPQLTNEILKKLLKG
jgi:aspartyl-tRNA(Asn)/glutamyl-tRNA(Gln) amidotransferase subunit B